DNYNHIVVYPLRFRRQRNPYLVKGGYLSFGVGEIGSGQPAGTRQKKTC
ncbi:unnamed protein product, partial [marine sediment metagenome]